MKHSLGSGDPGHNIRIDWEADENTNTFITSHIIANRWSHSINTKECLMCFSDCL